MGFSPKIIDFWYIMTILYLPVLLICYQPKKSSSITWNIFLTTHVLSSRSEDDFCFAREISHGGRCNAVSLKVCFVLKTLVTNSPTNSGQMSSQAINLLYVGHKTTHSFSIRARETFSGWPPFLSKQEQRTLRVMSETHYLDDEEFVTLIHLLYVSDIVCVTMCGTGLSSAATEK